MKIVRSLDLGSGYAKFNRLVDGKLDYMSFPSLAPRSTGHSLSAGLLGQRDTVQVTVEGTLYEVGPDSGDLDSNDSTRNLNDQFIYTDQYRAVLLGALHYMGETEIDLLVVGLPLTTVKRAEDLRKICTGTHKLADGKTVTVKDTLVLAQPQGGLHYCVSQANRRPEFEFIADDTNLIVDPGYLTFDFVKANGLKINDSRSGAHPGGVSKILRAICESLSSKFDMDYTNISAVDKALARRKIKINGKVEDLVEHIRFAKPSIEGSINFMKNVIGDGADIDNIILLGGGHNIFARTLSAYFKNHTIYVLPDAQFANVKGYQAAGDAHAKVKSLPLADDSLPPLLLLTYEGGAPAPAPAPAADI